ncbi:MAG: hypothetical protein ACHQIG_02900 [Acidimicrobiia bacterium]
MSFRHSRQIRGGKPIVAVCALVFVTGAVAAVNVSAALATGTTKFCNAVGTGAASLAQASSSGAGAAGGASYLRKLEKLAPTQSLKSSLKTAAGLYGRLHSGEKISDLGTKNVAKLNKALTKFSAYIGSNCETATTAPSASAGGLSGTWSGQYSGASEGTFTLTWQQSGSDVSGQITISEIGVPIDISGKLNGNQISFGTVGSLAVTYSGTVSGTSMSGTYKAPTGTGTWNATKTA